MFKPRLTSTAPDWLDADGIKLYTISATGLPVVQTPFLVHLESLKQASSRDWKITPAFAIFHDGASAQYLVLAAWGNDNELFTVVSVNTGSGWIEDRDRYAFCLWDMEVMWEERNIYIQTMYSGKTDLAEYRATRPPRWIASGLSH